MTIIETMGGAVEIDIERQYHEHKDWNDAKDVVESVDGPAIARAALRAVKPEDVTDAMVNDFYRIEAERVPGEDWMNRARRAIAAAIQAGGK